MGHRLSSCPTKIIPNNPTIPSAAPISTDIPPQTEDYNKYGKWMLVTRRRSVALLEPTGQRITLRYGRFFQKSPITLFLKILWIIQNLTLTLAYTKLLLCPILTRLWLPTHAAQNLQLSTSFPRFEKHNHPYLIFRLLVLQP
jgi:hypothetical protein